MLFIYFCPLSFYWLLILFIFVKADLYHASNLTVEEFRDIVKKSCKTNFNNGNGSVVIISYSRSVLHQTGSGHFSPIGGYCESKDLVLILDVARFKVNIISIFIYHSYYSYSYCYFSIHLIGFLYHFYLMQWFQLILILIYLVV